MTQQQITVIHCWSAPRSRSTAFMYSFEAGGHGKSLVCLDEPLYRAWLVRHEETVQRPYLHAMIHGVVPSIGETTDKMSEEDRQCYEQVPASHWKRECLSWSERLDQAASQLLSKQAPTGGGGGVIFCKHMAKHAELFDFGTHTVLTEDKNKKYTFVQLQPSKPYTFVHKHILLIRDPVAVLSSWKASASVHGNNPTSEEVGLVPLLQIYSQVTSTTNSSHAGVAVVVDSDELVRDPEAVLTQLVQELGIDGAVDPRAMMTWKAGPHLETDGPWAPWWYQEVHTSSGWTATTTTNTTTSAAPPSTDSTTASTGDGGGAAGTSSTTTTPALLYTRTYRYFPPELHAALSTCWPVYDFLRRQTREYAQRGPPPAQIYEDARNEHVLVYIGAPGRRGRLIPRAMAGVSPWDSSVQGGDATWEGLRVYRGKVFMLEAHLRRLFKSAKGLGFEQVHTREEILEAIFETLAANGMRDGAHMRLTLTRGEKCTSSMNPVFNVYGTTLIILPEWKPVSGGQTTYNNMTGIRLITASQRRNSPQTCDSKIHHNNMINNILPKIQANLAGCADALMLDLEGYVSETNATNVFMVDQGVLMTPHADTCLPGITRATVLQLAAELHIPTQVRRISLAEFHAADEVFTTGTMGELTPVTMIDGRVIGNTGQRGPITTRLQEAYQRLPERPGYATTLPPFPESKPLVSANGNKSNTAGRASS